MNDRRKWELLARKLAGEATKEEIEELEQMIKEDPLLSHQYDVIRNFWNGHSVSDEEYESEGEFQKLQSKIEVLKQHKIRRPPNSAVYKSFSMITNYLKTATRNFQRHRLISFINILGLSVGIACFCLLALYANNELSYDKFNKNANNIYRPYIWNRATNEYPEQGYMDYSGPTNITLGEALKRSFTDVIDYVRIQLPYDESILRIGDKGFRSNVTYADPSLFSVFSFPLKYGTVNTALQNLNDLVLTESKAREVFGSDDVIGKTIDIKIGRSFQRFVISAIAKDIPSNSTIHFDMLGNFLYAERYVNGSIFIGNDFHYIDKQTFVQLRPGSKLPDNAKQLQRFLASFNPEYLDGVDQRSLTTGADELQVSLKLQPLTAIHTSTLNLWHDFPRLNLKTIWILLLIGFGILLIACINFTTLAAGRSASRGKEVGVRKVLGASKKQVIIQFITEAYFLVIISGIIALLLVKLLLPYFNELSGSNLQISTRSLPVGFLVVAVMLLLVGLLAGSYPALVLSGFRPLDVFKNKLWIGGSNRFTKSLVTLQFALSIVLIVSTITILAQTKYMLNKSPGFNKDHVVVIDASETDPSKIFPLFKEAVSRNSAIENVSSAAAGIGAGKNYLGYSDQGLTADINIIDTNYIPVMGMKLVAGSNFTGAQINDTVKSMIINETMMKALGWTSRNAIGKRIQHFQGGTAVVTGVVKNFSYQPLSDEIKNQAFITSKDKGYVNYYVRLQGNNQLRAIADLQREWNNLLPGIPMKYSFLDEDINSYYQSEKTWSKIVGWASVVSIFLGCLGLLGLTMLAATNRTKEIGIRKLLGLSSKGIAVLLSKDILKPVIISMFIAFPIAWLAMNKWLQGFAFRINISWWMFAIAGLTALAIAIVTVSFQSIKAAVANPVKSLNTE